MHDKTNMMSSTVPDSSVITGPGSLSSYHVVHFSHDLARTPVWQEVCRYLQRFVHSDEDLLDIGAGYGECARFIQARRKWALDYNPDLVRHWAADVIPVIQSVLEPLPFLADSLGTVVASNLLEHFTLQECEHILSEIARVLRPGGRLVVIQPNFRLCPERYYDDYTHKTPFSDQGFVRLLQSLAWDIVHSEPRFLPFSMESRLPKWRPLIRLYLSLRYRPLAGQFLIVAETC